MKKLIASWIVGAFSAVAFAAPPTPTSPTAAAEPLKAEVKPDAKAVHKANTKAKAETKKPEAAK